MIDMDDIITALRQLHEMLGTTHHFLDTLTEGLTKDGPSSDDATQTTLRNAINRVNVLYRPFRD